MSDVRDPKRDQPLPQATDEPIIQDLVIADILERKEFGIRKYGHALQASNGRDMLLDAYQEAIDLVVYIKGELERRKVVQADALRAAADDWYGDGGPWEEPLSSATWLKERADRIENGG
jgi:hypothetical protein